MLTQWIDFDRDYVADNLDKTKQLFFIIYYINKIKRLFIFPMKQLRFVWYHSNEIIYCGNDRQQQV